MVALVDWVGLAALVAAITGPLATVLVARLGRQVGKVKENAEQIQATADALDVKVDQHFEQNAAYNRSVDKTLETMTELHRLAVEDRRKAS